MTHSKDDLHWGQTRLAEEPRKLLSGQRDIQSTSSRSEAIIALFIPRAPWPVQSVGSLDRLLTTAVKTVRLPSRAKKINSKSRWLFWTLGQHE